jgi:hypothetical protein
LLNFWPEIYNFKNYKFSSLRHRTGTMAEKGIYTGTKLTSVAEPHFPCNFDAKLASRRKNYADPALAPDLHLTGVLWRIKKYI